MRPPARLASHLAPLASALFLTAAVSAALRGQAAPTTRAASAPTAIKDLPMAAEERQRFIGRYTVAAAGSTRPAMSLRVFEEKGTLAGQIDGNAPTRLLYQGGNVFRPEQAPAFVVTFTVDGGQATRVSMVSPEGALSGARVDEGSGGGHVTPADPATSGALYEELARMDSLLFDAAFVTCDAAKANAILTDDIEFYHDKTGFESGQQVRETFQRLTGSCPGERGIRRELVTGSLQVYPMKAYGAVQTGTHRFVERGAPTMTVAKFVHLWRKANGEWKLSRVLSFDHRPASSSNSDR